MRVMAKWKADFRQAIIVTRNAKEPGLAGSIADSGSRFRQLRRK